jgi:predicted dehydrogenase
MGPAAWNDYTGDPAVFYSKDVGPMLDTGVYVLHAITGLLGPAKRVQAFGGIAIPHRTITIPRLSGQIITVGANDIMLIHLDFGNNRFAQILSTFAVPATRAPELEVHSANGTLSFAYDWYDAWGKLDLYRVGSAVEQVGPAGRPEGADGHLIGAGPAHFVACLSSEEQPILTAAHALHVLDIMLAATRSASEGCAVEVGTGFERQTAKS